MKAGFCSSMMDPAMIPGNSSRIFQSRTSITSGLHKAMDHCDITISIDCDGQDDIHAMEEMVKQYHEGSDIVYGVRNNRDTDSWFKRTTAQSYYKLLNRMDVEVVYNHADYRLVSSKVLHYFADFHEVNLFLRGMFPPLSAVKDAAPCIRRDYQSVD